MHGSAGHRKTLLTARQRSWWRRRRRQRRCVPQAPAPKARPQTDFPRACLCRVVLSSAVGSGFAQRPRSQAHLNRSRSQGAPKQNFRHRGAAQNEEQCRESGAAAAQRRAGDLRSCRSRGPSSSAGELAAREAWCCPTAPMSWLDCIVRKGSEMAAAQLRPTGRTHVDRAGPLGRPSPPPLVLSSVYALLGCKITLSRAHRLVHRSGAAMNIKNSGGDRRVRLGWGTSGWAGVWQLGRVQSHCQGCTDCRAITTAA